MKRKFMISACLGWLWMLFSLLLAFVWADEITCVIPAVYVWWVIIGIALLPGLLMSTMFFSNLLHSKLEEYPDTDENTTVLMCAHNEEKSIAKAITSILNQQYNGHICLIVVDNCSTDSTKQEILRFINPSLNNRLIKYIFCDKEGKANALNLGLKMVCTPHFITVDADTYLEKGAVQKIMNYIVSNNSACTAGNLFVDNVTGSITAKMQIYDYLLSIAAIKRFQGSYKSTLVAQGAFSAYNTHAVRDLGGWQNVLGEDIVLTYQLLKSNFSSTYEPCAVGYTCVPQSLNGLYNQRKRWAIGMLEGLCDVPPWRQGNIFSRHFAFVNLSVIYLDLAFMFGFIPGVILAFLGYYYLVGFPTLITLGLCILLYYSVYLYQKNLKIPFKNSLLGLICFLLFFQPVQSMAALHGYFIRLLQKKGEWK